MAKPYIYSSYYAADGTLMHRTDYGHMSHESWLSWDAD
jgi:hypothetical protein